MINPGAAVPILGRRETLAGFMSSFVLVALIREARAATPKPEGAARRWISGQAEIADGLARGSLTGIEWAREVERLASEVDVPELMTLVRRSRVEPARPGGPNDPQKRVVRFLDDLGQPRRLSYGAALFDFSPANVITPHGHRHMASAHLVVEGRLRVRNFDRLGHEGDAMRLRPTRDYVARVGQVSTMCDERDNIHWFVPQGGPATTFDVVISGLDPGAPDHIIQAVDPLAAAPRADGTLLAPIIGFGESSRRYTANI